MVKKVKLCPKCQEPKLKSAVNVSGWLAPDMYECTNCGYVGQIYLEVAPKEYEELKIQKLNEVYSCPTCNHESLKFDKEITKTLKKELYKCSNCGYIGTQISEVDIEDLEDAFENDNEDD